MFLLCVVGNRELSFRTLQISCAIGVQILPVKIVGSVPCDDGHWDTEDIIDGQLEEENSEKTKLTVRFTL